MLLVKDKLDRDASEFDKMIPTQSLSLPFEIRQKARFVAALDSGMQVGLQIDRGHILRDGDKLIASDGTVIHIKAANEAVSTVSTLDQKMFARVCYHLGNRHVPLQVESDWCRYLQDHVLDDMVELLGGDVVHESAPFEPEAGAYAGGHHHRQSPHNSGSVPSIDDIKGFSLVE